MQLTVIQIKDILKLHGWIEGTEVSISSKVAGEIKILNIDEGSMVKSADLIVQISSNQIKARLDNIKALVEQTRATAVKAHYNVEIIKSTYQGAKIAYELVSIQSEARIKQAQANLAAAKVALHQAEINFSRANKEYIRFSRLIKKKTISASKMDMVEEAHKIAMTQVEKAKRGVAQAAAALTLATTSQLEIKLKKNDIIILENKINAAIADENIAKSALVSAIAQQKEVEATLEDTYIRSPMDGTVTEKLIEKGENVAMGSPLIVLTDLSNLFVKTYIEQIEIGKIKLDDPCKISIDTFPDRTFRGKIIYISSKAEFTPRDIQMDDHRSSMVYKIKVGINNQEGVLKPGMPADINLKWIQ